MLKGLRKTPYSYMGAFFLYSVLFFSTFFLRLGSNGVIAPYLPYGELGVPANHHSNTIENRKFSDYFNGYIPEISEHISASRSSWLALWTNKNEIGRPLYHLSGFSPAYFPTWILTRVIETPLYFITVFSVLTCYLSGLFVILYCRQISLHPLAGLISACTVAMSPFFMYWLTFPMFASIWCWAAGVLWSLTRVSQRPDIIGCSVLSFSTYSLLLTAYPQGVVLQAYILIAYGVYIFLKIFARDKKGAIYFALVSLLAVIFGVVLALPVYIDLYEIALESARKSPDVSFFSAILPSFSSYSDVVRYLVISFVPELYGNPIHPEYPFSYDGISITLYTLFFLVLSFLVSFRYTWGWWFAVLVFILLTFWTDFYHFAVKYLGFGLSRTIPLGSVMLPFVVIVAYGVDFIARYRFISTSVLFFSFLFPLLILLVAVVYGYSFNVPVRWGIFVLEIGLLALLLFYVKVHNNFFVIAGLILCIALSSYPMILRHGSSLMRIYSPLVDVLMQYTSDGSRYAVVSQGVGALPPNFNAAVGLSSYHSYNSLSSTRYHTLTRQLGGRMETYGRYNGVIKPDYDSTAFWMSNISVVLSSYDLNEAGLDYVGEYSGIKLYHVVDHMGSSVVVSASDGEISDIKFSYDKNKSVFPVFHPLVTTSQGDFLDYSVSVVSESVLILSQKFYFGWRARVLTDNGWVGAKTVIVNDVFQGVILPAGTKRVQLNFLPFARFAYLGHIIWFFVLIIILVSHSIKINKRACFYVT